MEVGILQLKVMKKSIFTLVAACCAIPSLAQLNGDGYYRIQNAGTERYMSIVNNKIDNANKSAVKGGGSGYVYSMATVTGYENVISDAGSILYIESNNGSKYDFNIKGQGMYTYTLTGGMTLKIAQNSDKTYRLYGSQSGLTRDLSDVESTNEKECIYIAAKEDKAVFKWNIKPIDQTNEYFSISPEVLVDDKYYATVYFGFPVKVNSNMKAYYVKRTHTGTDLEEQVAEMTEISDGIIPPSTPAIVECASIWPTDNIVTLLKEEDVTTTYKDNKLKGQFFNYVKLTLSGKESSTSLGQELKNVTEYNEATMRILGNVDGKLGFVKATADDLYLGKYLKGNRCYLPVSKAGDDITLVDAEQFAVGIQNIATEESAQGKVYSLTGTLISENGMDNLPKGIYILNGKKVIKK